MSHKDGKIHSDCTVAHVLLFKPPSGDIQIQDRRQIREVRNVSRAAVFSKEYYFYLER
jgi:hypothetical protein